MSRQKDSPKVPEPAAADPLKPPAAAPSPPPSDAPLAARIRAFAAKDDVIAGLRAQREEWEAAGLSEVPDGEKEERRRQFSNIARAWPGALADISRLTQTQLRDRATALRILAERLEAKSHSKLHAVDVELVRLVLVCEVWRAILREPSSSERTRKERVLDETQQRMQRLLEQ